MIRLKVNRSFPFKCRVNLKSSLPCNRRLRIGIDINAVIIQRYIFVLLYSRVLLTFSVPRIIIWLNAWIVIILLCLRRIFVCFISRVIKLTRCWCRRRLWFPRLLSLAPKGETQIAMVKWTNAGGQTIQANEGSFVYRPPAWRRWRNVKTTYIYCILDVASRKRLKLV